MEPMELPTDVVHPEVRAHITSLVSALGGTDEDGQYQLGDDALDVLRDIKKWIRFYDQKLNRMDVARCLADTNLVGGDLLRILATWHENATAQRFKARVALACYEVLTPLTWPLETDVETATVNHYRHLPVLQLAQLAYKRAVINFDGAQILHTAVRVALPAMAVPLADRAMRDQGIIKLVLFFLRNVAMIEPPAGVQYDGDESQVSRSATIDAFSYQDILLLLLTMASNMGDDFRTEDATVMEIVFHLVKRVDIHKLFMDHAQLTSTKASELTALMHKEAAMLQASRPHGPTRHSRFGTMVWVDRGEGRMSALSGQDALVSASARELKMDTTKKFRPPRRPRRRRDEKQELMGLGPSVSLNARANGQLRGFVDELLDAGFNPLFQHVRRSIEREAPHIQHHHRAQFLYLVSWFLEAERVRHKAAQQRGRRDAAGDVSSFNLVAGALNQEMFIFLNRTLDQAQNDKDWAELTVVMRCYTQILLTVQQMSESKSEEDEEIAENILSRLFYEESTHDAVANMVRNYKDQGYEYLDACTELAHTYLRILETYSKQNVDLQVRSRRRTRKKKKAARKAAAVNDGSRAGQDGDGGDGEEAAEGELRQNDNDDNDDDDDDDESGNDEALAQKTSTERKFDFTKFATRFAAQGVVDTFVKFTSNYNDLTEAQLKRAHRYFYRIAFKQEMSVMLFRVDIIRLLFNMIKGPEPLNRSSNAVYKDWEELSKQILRKCVKKIEERPVLIIEMLFSKSASTAHFLEYGYEKQTISTTNPRPAAELEFRHAVERDRQIAIVVGVLLDKNQHQHLLWVKRQLEAAEAERRAWKALDVVMDTLEIAGPDGIENGSGAPPAEPSAGLSGSEASPITIRPEDEACRKAMFKNAHLRLLMQLVGFERLVPLIEETPDSVWVVPGSITAEQLRESLDFINRAEFEPPVFDNEQSAEDQLKRKTAARKKAVYDDDDDENGLNGSLDGDDEMLFPLGGPTARKVVDGERKKKAMRRRRKRRGDGDSDSDGDMGPTEEELDERAKLRRQKELEKARRIKSDLYVHASDDETDDEKDREFFAREEAIRQRVHKAVLLSRQYGEAEGGEAAGRKAKPKRKSTVLSDDEDGEDGEDDEDDEDASSRELTTSAPSRRRKRRRSAETDEDDESDEDVLKPTAAPRKKSSRQHAGFVDSSSDEDEDADGNADGNEDGNADGNADGNMDTDDTPMSLSPHVVSGLDKAATDGPLSEKVPTKTSDKVSDKASEKAPGDAGKDSDSDDEDEDDDVPTAGKKRQRVRGGFLADSDDDDE